MGERSVNLELSAPFIRDLLIAYIKKDHATTITREKILFLQGGHVLLRGDEPSAIIDLSPSQESHQ